MVQISMSDMKKKSEPKGSESGTMTPIGRLLGDVLSKCHSGTATGMRAVMALWPQAVGDGIAANTRPAAFNGRLLLVHVASPVWIQELRFQKSDIIRKLNDAAGKDIVSDITFKIGPTE